ncbi:MAG TPA: hypothetical protein VEU47_16380 [Candidatus Cybelea sp.]|nr:hypothetical protein [Candidatus Cybelea sp.]
MADPSAPKIRIVRVPPGEAPLWVREKWVGLELPLAFRGRKPHKHFTSGVLSASRNPFVTAFRMLLGRLDRQAGYAVDAVAALAVLERSAPDAARWWRDNAQWLIKDNRKFLFQADVCELIGEPRR